MHVQRGGLCEVTGIGPAAEQIGHQVGALLLPRLDAVDLDQQHQRCHHGRALDRASISRVEFIQATEDQRTQIASGGADTHHPCVTDPP